MHNKKNSTSFSLFCFEKCKRHVIENKQATYLTTVTFPLGPYINLNMNMFEVKIPTPKKL
jgi:hypothetical protein